MRYKSNLSAPDLRPYFKLLDPPMQHAGHDEPSDPDFGPACGWWTGDEAAILFNVAKSVPPGTWVDIGARLGWTAAHVAEAGHQVMMVDPEFMQSPFFARVTLNTQQWAGKMVAFAGTASRYFNDLGMQSDGFVIDGCHDSPEPLNDAKAALAHAKPDCIILFHDFQGPAVRDGVRFLMDNGWRCRVYWTPNQVACCWRGHEWPNGEWLPPFHVPDPLINWRSHKDQMTDFKDYWERCE